MASLGRRLWRWTAGTIALIVILLGLAVGVFRILVAQVPGYRQHIESLASDTLDSQVRIGDAALEWGWHGPELVLRNVRLLGPQDRVVILRARALKVGISLNALAFQQTLQARHVVLVQPVADLAYYGGQWRLAGVPVGGGERETRDWRSLLALIPPAGSAEVEDADIRWTDARRQGWRFEHLNLTLSADGSHYHMAGESGLPAPLGTRVAFAMDADGPRLQPEQWHWSLQFSGDGLQPGMVDSLAGVRDSELRGSLRLKGHAQGTGAQVASVDGQLHGESLMRVPLEPSFSAPGDHSLDMLSGDLHWRRAAKGWRLDLTNVVLVRGDRQWPVDQLHLRRQQLATGSRWELSADYLNLADVQLVAGLLPGVPADWQRQLQKVRPRGEVKDLAAHWQTDTTGLNGYAARAEFTGLGWRPSRGLPGLTGLDGAVALNQAGGRAVLSSDALTADFNGLFRAPLDLTQFKSDVYWQRRPGKWEIGTVGLALANDDIGGVTGQLRLTLPDDGPGRIDLTAGYSDIDFRHKSRYFPTAIMSDGLVHWLDSSILSGQSPQGELVIRGPLDRFPYPDGGGVFHIAGDLRHTVLQYGAGWPQVNEIRGRLDFTGPGFSVNAESAQTAGMQMQASAGMHDMRKGLLWVKAQSHTVAGKTQDFVRHSPIAERFGGILDRVRLEGQVDADFDMQLPVADTSAVKVGVKLRVPDGTVRVRGLDAPFTHVNETLHFTQDGVSTPALKARWLGQEVKGDIQDHADATVMQLSGSTSLEALRRQLGWALPAALSGTTDWHAELRLAKHAAGVPLTLTLSSDLAGLGSSLPAPLGKAVDEPWPSEARLAFVSPRRVELNGNLGDRAGVWMALETIGDNTRLSALHLRAGHEHAPPLKGGGILVDGRLEKLDLDGWALPGNLDLKLPPLRAVNLTIDRLTGFGQSLNTVNLQAARGEAAWNLAVDSKPVAGRIRIPDDFAVGPIRADMQRLHLQLPEASGESRPTEGKPSDPRSFPGLLLQVDDLQLGKMRLGRLHARVERVPDGLALRQLVFSAPHLNGNATGSWTGAEGGKTAIKGALSSDDLGSALKTLGYPEGIDADTAQVNFDLNWPGGPQASLPRVLAGNLHLALADGQLREVKPGAGRLVGLLSVAALPRRLVLDFSDVFSKGLSFDSLSADFRFADGSAYTRDLSLKGPAVSAEMVGRTGLVARDYDLIAVVNADISSSLPVAGALAAGPQAGAVMWLLSQLLKTPINTMARREYHVTGTWDNPVIEPMAAPAAKETH